LFEHDLRANAFRVCREGKPRHTFPDRALVTSQLRPYNLLAVEAEAANDAARGITRNDCLHYI